MKHAQWPKSDSRLTYASMDLRGSVQHLANSTAPFSCAGQAALLAAAARAGMDLGFGVLARKARQLNRIELSAKITQVARIALPGM